MATESVSIDIDRRGTKSIKITIQMGKRNRCTDARVCLFPFFLFFHFFHAVHGRTSSEQMAEYDSRAKLASEYFATNADFANHSSIAPLGLPWFWPQERYFNRQSFTIRPPSAVTIQLYSPLVLSGVRARISLWLCLDFSFSPFVRLPLNPLFQR